MNQHQPNNIAAAGGVVIRREPALAIALIRRIRYDDWTLPKGKLEPGEGALEAAQREVLEETGFSTTVIAQLGDSSYFVGSIPKVVHFWLMETEDTEPAPAPGEIDEVAWFLPSEAIERLTYQRDREILEEALTLLG